MLIVIIILCLFAIASALVIRHNVRVKRAKHKRFADMHAATTTKGRHARKFWGIVNHPDSDLTDLRERGRHR